MRRQSHLCLRDVLSRFQETSLLGPASEGITKIFERSLLLAGGSNVNSNEGHKGAQEVLFVLDALKECLPYMSLKCTTSILKHFKSLLELNQPVVSRRITDSLYSLCLAPALDVSPDALLDLLSSIALSVSTIETSVDAMTFAARLLDVGMIKVYSLDRQMCVTKLPAVFNALKGLFYFLNLILFIFHRLENPFSRVFFFNICLTQPNESDNVLVYFSLWYWQIFWHPNMRRLYMQPWVHLRV